MIFCDEFMMLLHGFIWWSQKSIEHINSVIFVSFQKLDKQLENVSPAAVEYIAFRIFESMLVHSDPFEPTQEFGNKLDQSPMFK